MYNYIYIYIYIILHTADDSVRSISSLENAIMRNKWEDMFNTHYIQNILKNVNEEIGTVINSILEDSKQGCTAMSQLLYTYYTYTNLACYLNVTSLFIQFFSASIFKPCRA